MAAMCRQRAKIDGEDVAFWTAEAASWQSHADRLAEKVVVPLTKEPVT